MTVVRKHAKADDAPYVIQAARVTKVEVEGQVVPLWPLACQVLDWVL